MTGFEIGLISIVAMLLLIYIGMHVPVVLALISFVGVIEKSERDDYVVYFAEVIARPA